MPGSEEPLIGRMGEAFPEQSAQPHNRHARHDSLKVIDRIGVSDGIRTRDVQIHSLALYQAELRSPRVVLQSFASL